MKSVIKMWHPVHTEARRGPLFADVATELRDAEVVEGRVEAAPMSAALLMLTKNTKSLSKARI